MKTNFALYGSKLDSVHLATTLAHLSKPAWGRLVYVV